MSTSQLLDHRYKLVRPAVVRGDRSGRVPSLYDATDKGLFLYAKVWPRAGASADLRGLWNHEVRSLLRLSGYPRADQYFVRLKDLGVEPRLFYVILDAGERTPLSRLLAERNRHPWLRDVSTPARRRRIWEGLTRVATALAILHAEGTLHRALNPTGVFTDDRGDCDFRLSGFEWSLRVSAASPIPGQAASAGSRMRAPELDIADAQYSFGTDWFDFGLLAAELFGLNITGRANRSLERLHEQILALTYLGAPEKHALLGLLDADPERRLAQSSTVLQGLSEALSSVRSRTITYGHALYVGFLLGSNSSLSEAISEVTRGSRDIHPTEVEKQLDFIERDLDGDPTILIRQAPFPHYVLNGRLLQYRIQQWSRQNIRTWDVGFCMSAELPRHDPSERTALLDGRQLELRTAPKLARDLKRARSLAAAWDAVFPFATMLDPLSEEQRNVLDFFRLTNQLDAMLAAAQLWPIRVVSAWEADERTFVDLTPEPDDQRTALAANLKLAASDEQMRDFFVRDSTSAPLPEDTEFTLAYDGVLGRGEEESNIRWRYDQVIEHPAGVHYRLYHEEPSRTMPAENELMYLMPRGLAGTVAQLKRRHRAIDAMRNHAGLLAAIADPAHNRHDTSDEPGTSPAIESLDESKRDAISGIWRTQPLYTLQGPPGTGKTRLLETMVTRLLELDGSIQVLVTAHSHEAVRHVRRQLAKRIASSKPEIRPIVIRLDDENDEDYVQHTASRLARAIAGSPLAAGAPPHLVERAKATALDIVPGQPQSRDMRSFQSLVRQAANVVFATSNSGELARMLEDDRRFDWSIIEEAGKAHGFDLALALQASYRVLFIGDHEQLPPFNFETLEALFREPPRILNALKVGPRFAPGLVDRVYIDLDEEDQQRFAESCTSWLDMVQFFAEMFRRCELSDLNGVKIARQLQHQHRMHPDIACMISQCFYKNTLETHETAKERFATEPVPFLLKPSGWMPEQRIVFVDMPWVQDEKFATGEMGGVPGSPRYTNAGEEGEVEAVCRALSQFEARNGTQCHIQVLSPYRPQVRLLTSAVAEEIATGRLRSLAAQEFEMKGKRLGATVDEFQGSEADVVVVSLVRNNDERIGRGVGFLADRRRVNVLLSRARQKLVLVGSWSFLESRIDCSVEPKEEEELAHIARLMRWLEANRSGPVARIPFRETYWGTQR